MGPGVSESGPRASSNASSTAAQAGFTLGPSIPAKSGTVASSTSSRPVVPTAAPDSSLAQGPKSLLFESKGATKTILIGCVMPFEGSDQAVVGKAVHAALKMALEDLGPTLKLPVNVNLTCLNTKVRSKQPDWVLLLFTARWVACAAFATGRKSCKAGCCCGVCSCHVLCKLYNSSSFLPQLLTQKGC
jgi:hypothetical protein